MHIKTAGFIIISLLAFIACENEDVFFFSQESKQLEGYWVNLQITDTLFTCEKADSLFANQYGFAFLPGGKFIERKNAGWCGTPPIAYADFEGSWSFIDSIIEVTVGYWGGTVDYRWKEIWVDNDSLAFEVISEDIRRKISIFASLMNIELVHSKDVLYEFLQKEAGLQVYLTGDLDDFFWPKTCWYALKEKEVIKAVALMYAGMLPPTLLCFQNRDPHHAIRLLHEIKPLLPGSFYVHLGEGFADVFGRRNIVEHYGINYKMVLHKKVHFNGDSNIRRLGVDDLSLLVKLYSKAYPNNWFDSRMLESGKYFGYFGEDELVGVAGIHVYSVNYKAAALGNITTHPEFRQQGIGYKLTAALCADLQQDVDVIGLNVRSDNYYGIRLYNKLGFHVEGRYEECLIKNRLDV